MRGSSYKDYLETLTEISHAITSDKYLDDILMLIVDTTANVMKAKIIALWLLDEKKQTLSLRATQYMNKSYIGAREYKIGEGIVGHVAKDKKPITVLNVLEDDRYIEKDLAAKDGLVSMLSVPMMVKDKLIGVCNCFTTKEYKFVKSDIDMLNAIANHAAVAIENTELMVKTKVVQEELESRKKVERAKGILMKNRGLSEEEAFNLIRKSSMNKRMSMKEVADAIILSAEIV